MQNNYNINQLSLAMATDYQPEENHPAYYIHQLVENLAISKPNIMGRPREYDPRMLLKLVLLAYSYGIVSCRKIERFARENIVAMWLTQEQRPTYRTIARFIVSKELTEMIQASFKNFHDYLQKAGLIDEASFIDGTKILANANKYSFVWKKRTIKYSDLNVVKARKLISEMREEVKVDANLDDFQIDELDTTIALLEQRVEELNKRVEETARVSPNPAKQERRHAKKYLRALDHCRQKNIEYKAQVATAGKRNSYSKTDHDATFMRLKEDPMRNGQTKPAYNLQIMTNSQFVLGYDLLQNPTDTRTLIPFLKQLDQNGVLGKEIVADAGYGSERNYRYIEDELPDCTALIPYSTMLRENSRKWKSDDRKVMNWEYHAKDDYYINPVGVRFNFKRYAYRNDKDGFHRDFKVYQAEKYDKNHQINPKALTPHGNTKYIMVNPQWEYFKAKAQKSLSSSNTYSRRKYDVETVFGNLKAYLGFTSFTVRGLKKVKKQIGIALMALNMKKLAGRPSNFLGKRSKRKDPFENFFNFRMDLLNLGTYVTVPFFIPIVNQCGTFTYQNLKEYINY
ncbi:IS1182 family transposase [Limosilactobacillus sp. BG-MG3-A]|uniref:IS1182 family transposase n=3 Tax=Limosilactobacillus agrestis TaxID=2759748 RepID=A0A7W3YLM1_9LACO|nr:IS1182 family transposase [Limosilactobacillus agrestis]MBB1096183.1 IS1182 family transposase [Limosilactobacillus agrestis]